MGNVNEPMNITSTPKAAKAKMLETRFQIKEMTNPTYFDVQVIDVMFVIQALTNHNVPVTFKGVSNRILSVVYNIFVKVIHLVTYR